MNRPVALLLGDGSRLHLQHGPIDLIIGADPGGRNTRQRAFQAAAERFDTVLEELVGELPLLRSAVTAISEKPQGPVARRMDRAVRPHVKAGFVTHMAAVAGAVADEVLAAMAAAGPLARAYVNNGGDIALYLEAGQTFRTAMAGLDGADLGRIDIAHESGIRGIATSGQGGRSLSFGIADSVTVLAKDAATADVAATLLANAVDLPDHASIRRTPADQVQPDSDLGRRKVVTHVGLLSDHDITSALEAGRKPAMRMLQDGLIAAASVSLRGQQVLVGPANLLIPMQSTKVEYVQADHPQDLDRSRGYLSRGRPGGEHAPASGGGDCRDKEPVRRAL